MTSFSATYYPRLMPNLKGATQDVGAFTKRCRCCGRVLHVSAFRVRRATVKTCGKCRGPA